MAGLIDLFKKLPRIKYLVVGILILFILYMTGIINIKHYNYLNAKDLPDEKVAVLMYSEGIINIINVDGSKVPWGLTRGRKEILLPEGNYSFNLKSTYFERVTGRYSRYNTSGVEYDKYSYEYPSFPITVRGGRVYNFERDQESANIRLIEEKQYYYKAEILASTLIQFLDQVKVLPDGNRIIATDYKSIFIWDLYTKKKIMTINPRHSKIIRVSFSNNGEIIAAGFSDGTIHIYNSTIGNLITAFSAHEAPVRELRFSPDDSLLISSSCVFGYYPPKNTLDIRDTKNYQSIKSIDGRGLLEAVAFSPDGSTILVGADFLYMYDSKTFNQIDLWEIEDLTISDGRRESGYKFNQISFTPNVEYYIAVILNEGHLDLVKQTIFGNYYVDDGGFGYKSYSTGYGEWERSGHVNSRYYSFGRINSFALNSDGTLLATGGEDSTVILWDALAEEEIITLKGHKNSCYSVNFSPDGNKIISSDGKKILIWDLNEPELKQIIQSKREVFNDFRQSNNLLNTIERMNREIQ